MAEEKKNHHYVPASYLRGFAIDGEDSLGKRNGVRNLF